MHCLRWWLPIFILPLPAASPFLLFVFIALYAIRTKPCTYCSVIILGLLTSTCYFYAEPKIAGSTGLDGSNATLSSSASEAMAVESIVAVTSSASALSSEALSSSFSAPSPSATADVQLANTTTSAPSSPPKQPSTCWMGFTLTRHLDEDPHTEHKSLDLGWWTSPPWRKYPSALSQRFAVFNTTDDSSYWHRFLHDGIFIGYDNVGFRLKLGLQ